MKILFDFFPVILFFVAFKTYDLYVATAVIMVASLIQIAAHWLKKRSFETTHIVTFVIVLLLGGATLALHDERFIKLKPSLASWISALIFAGSHFVGSRRPVIRRLLEEQLTLTSSLWNKLNIAWIIFFILTGALNLVVAKVASTEIWVNFKLFGILGATLAFLIIQLAIINKISPQKPIENGEPK